MKKQYIISENQLKYLVEDLLSETPIVDYVFDDFGVDHNKVFFNGAKKFRPKEGEISDDTSKIRLFNKKNNEFIFDVDDVKFSKEPYFTPFVSLSKFNEKYGKKDESTPEVTDEQIKSVYKEAVFNALQELYKESSNWDSKSGRGPNKRGGVVNIYQVGDYAKEIGLENFEGGDWSIMNYFDTNPKVREEIIQEYKRKNNIDNITDIQNFKKWIVDNKSTLFDNSDFLKRIIELNKRSYLSGLKNEMKAFNFINSFLTDTPNLQLSSLNLPGSPKDRSGIDFSLIKDGKEIRTYQAKPFSGYYINEYNGKKTYRVYSYNIENLKNLNVSYFVFASDGKDGAIVFENKKGEYAIGKKGKSEFIEFNYEPKYYDPNF
jgi:hypothetical protein